MALLLTAGCTQKAPHSIDRDINRDLDRYGDVPEPIANGRTVPSTGDSLDIRRRADSLAALNPWREAAAAIARGDTRYMASCNFTCVAIGVVPDSICLVRDCAGLRRNEVLTVKGTEEFPITPDVARLDSITNVYGARYNAVVHDVRARSARRFPPAGNRARYRTRPAARRLIVS